ncbi:MAG: B12-binding domain-containing radical SAM protein [Actinobacteria bacterium]|nr:B12-binding domain-containing radical SAM protein [Actinomycetota bacterium]MBU1943358.1 B12-binding domain-containing radical SAM protein [Actinomycetota bacterium]MBU2686524.1 B12-binding domain-containing radical SAM protein [Actinomycetota bacterium]
MTRLKTLLISDTAALGVMEARPEPAWRVRLTGLRNKELLAPDYGAMHVVANLEAAGHPVRVVNVVADVHGETRLFDEPNTDPDAHSGSLVAAAGAAEASRGYLFRALDEYRPDVVFVTLSTYNLALYSRRLLAGIREALLGGTLVTGGVYSTMHPDEVLSDGHVDVVVRGEGEVTALELLSRLEAGRDLDGLPGISYRSDGDIFHNAVRPPVRDLDVLPHPYTVSDAFNISRRFEILSELLPHGDWIPGAGFLTSRGCPEACAFCLDPALNNGRVRFHSPSYVREVLEYCAGRFSGGAGAFFFGDATFTMNHKRLAKILDMLGGLPYTYQIQTRADYLDRHIIARLAGCGFTNVAIGAESFNEEILARVVRKRLEVDDVIEAATAVRRAGMEPVLTFIVGLPGETAESVWRTVGILKEHGLTCATFFPLVVFKGTALFEEFARRVPAADRERFRLNPVSEEFLFSSEAFPTPEELTGFTEKVNKAVMDERLTPGAA